MILTLEDCLALCELSEEEVLAIAEHEHVPGAAAAEMGNYLVHTADGALAIRAMIRDDIAAAAARGDLAHAAALKLVLQRFIRQHRKCASAETPARRLSGTSAG